MGEAVTIKGTKNGLVIFLGQNLKFEEIKANLIRRMESANGFFKGAKFSIHPEIQGVSLSQVKELENICLQHGLVSTNKLESGFKISHKPFFKTDKHQMFLPGESAILIRRTLRSGQRVSYPTNIVILGDINPGAELEAGENIVIMGHCKGTLSAGIKGNTNAKIIAYRLTPLRISIAGVTSHLKKADKKLPSCSQVAHLVNGKIVIESFPVLGAKELRGFKNI